MVILSRMVGESLTIGWLNLKILSIGQNHAKLQLEALPGAPPMQLVRLPETEPGVMSVSFVPEKPSATPASQPWVLPPTS
jgi:hypothetical protein